MTGAAPDVIAAAPREVELPVCPTCGLIGKMPASVSLKGRYCVGPKGEPHKKIAMQPRRFREIVDEGEAMHGTR